MGKAIVKEYDNSVGILKYFEYKGKSVLVGSSLATSVNGHSIVLAGTPYPANDATCEGYILEDVDVTQGDAPATVIYVGSIDEAKAKAHSSVTVSANAKGATPRVSFL